MNGEEADLPLQRMIILLRLLNRGVNVLGPDYVQNLAYHYTDGLYSYTTLDFIRAHALAFGLIGFADDYLKPSAG